MVAAGVEAAGDVGAGVAGGAVVTVGSGEGPVRVVGGPLDAGAAVVAGGSARRRPHAAARAAIVTSERNSRRGSIRGLSAMKPPGPPGRYRLG